ncbi:MAG: helix-turn-helix transcriptional regulator [Gammaproteobacteria bacterium]|nr:helix-turn-helix transcriptional regulator [Gammaproteobacteria bacterium]
MTKLKDLHDKWYKNDPEYAAEYDALEDEFALASAVINARKQANLTQEELAKKMETTQAQIARIEGGKMPSMRTLERLAAATGTQLKVTFESVPK